jgi:hypothetical protein
MSIPANFTMSNLLLDVRVVGLRDVSDLGNTHVSMVMQADLAVKDRIESKTTVTPPHNTKKEGMMFRESL